MKKQLLSLMAGLFLAFSSFGQLNNYSVGQTAPNFTVTDLHGHVHNLSDYAGKYVLIDLFAYWCGPCQAVSPIINSFYKKYGCNGYDVVVLAIEYEGSLAQTESYEAAYGGDASYPTPTVSGLAGGGGAVHSTYGPAAYPTIILIGPDGKFKNIDIWPISSIANIESAITSAGGGSVLVEHSCESLSIEDLAIQGLNIFPNPSNGNFTLEMEDESSNQVMIEVYSLLGNKLWEKQITSQAGMNSTEISLNSFASGTYLLNITTNGKTIVKNIQIN
jgi:thiol-disulfide isomerase/thioredoxin